MNEAIKIKLSKILKLVTDGIGGEREAAQKRLDELMVKHNISMEELIDEQPVWCVIPYTTEWEQKLLVHTAGKLCGLEIVNRTEKDEMHFSITRSKGAELRILFDIYKQAFADEQENLFVAFIHRHQLFPETDDHSEPLTWEEERMRRVQEILDNLPGVQIHGRIEGK